MHKVGFICLVMALHLSWAGTWLRYNHAGFTPSATKSLVIMANSSQEGKSWSIKKDGVQVLSGEVPASSFSEDASHPKNFNHLVDFSALSDTGAYSFNLGELSGEFAIKADPYSLFATQALRHLRVARSGTVQTLLHQASHLGDSAAIVAAPQGDLDNGAWQIASPQRTVDMRGGWYDAGDYIKFTLNEAYTVWNLLNAYEHNPKFFPKVYSQSSYPDILDEALHGLDYLAKTFPDENTFIIQVGTSADHSQGNRLPESDALEGKRQALSALSRVHMGATAAALAQGARVFAELDATRSAKWRTLAQSILTRALSDDAVRTAYEKDATNDFYRTNRDSAMITLAAAELYELTQDAEYLNIAQSWAPPKGYEVGWASWNFFANATLGQWDESALSRATEEAQGYATKAQSNIWGFNYQFLWASLHRWMGAANACGRLQANVEQKQCLESMRDVLFGRNPWGVSFIFSQDLPNTVRNIYSQIYPLLDEFPVGAISEGPGDVATHEDMAEWMTMPADHYLKEFNTSAAVFYDHGKHFMTQEATITGQGDFVYLMALVSDKNFTAAPDSGVGGAKASVSKADTTWLVPATSLTWHSYDDQGEGGASTATPVVKSDTDISTHWQVNASTTLDYQYAGMNTNIGLNKLTAMTGLILRMDVPPGVAVKIQLEQNNVKDYGYHSKVIVGKGEDDYRIDFDQFVQPFGAAVAMDPSKIIRLGIMCETAGADFTISVSEVEFYGYEDQIITPTLQKESQNTKKQARKRFTGSQIEVFNGKSWLDLQGRLVQ